jgi:hypothetical protein
VSTVKQALLALWLKWPYGNICAFRYGDLNIAVRKNGWVVISDGVSRDMLPLSYTSPQLIEAVDAEMTRMGYCN